MKDLTEIIKLNLNIEEDICYFYDKYQVSSSHSYSDILKHSTNYAKNLQEIIPGHKQPILISLETSKEFLFSFFGVMLAGHIPVPVTSSTLILPKDYQELLMQISSSCDSKYIITDNKHKLDGLNYIKMDQLLIENDRPLNAITVNEDDICFIQFSSGSTQNPKGIAITHLNILENLKQIHRGMDVTTFDSICSWLPLHHDMGLIGTLLASLYSKVCSHLMAPIDFILSPKSWLKLLSDQKISIIVAPNSAYHACTKKVSLQDAANLDLSHLRLALSGAEPVNLNICEKFTKHFEVSHLRKNVIFPVYGLAECTLAVSFNEVGSKLKTLCIDYLSLVKEKKVVLTEVSDKSTSIVSSGKALLGISIEIKNEDGEKLTENNIGEVYIKGPAIVKNYFNQESHLKNGWLASGDLGFIHNENLYIVGRKKDLIILNGKNIAANDIETKACEIPELKLGKTVAFSFTDKLQKEQVRLVAEVCVTDKEKREKIKINICEKVKGIIPLTPEKISLVPPLLVKKTTSGKVKRFYIKQMYLEDKVQLWEKSFHLFFLKSQVIILKLKIVFFFKEKVASTLKFKKNKEIERYQCGNKS